MHAYLVLNCKTPGCSTEHVAKYLGEEGKLEPSYAIEMPTPFLIPCPDCGQTHDYVWGDLRRVEAAMPPPAGWTSQV